MRTLTTTTAALAALAWLPPAIPTSAQVVNDATAPFCNRVGVTKGPCRLRSIPPQGMIPCRAGEHRCDTTYLGGDWRPPTVTEALEALQREWELDGWDRSRHPAVAILRQMFGPRPAAELNAFADRLAEIAADATLPEHVRMRARFALAGAANTDESYYMGGTPYPRAFDLLVQVRESGNNHALSDIMGLDSVRGLAYMRELFERSERPALVCRWVHVDGEWEPVIGGFYLPAPLPPQCDDHHWLDDHYTPWCKAGGYLFGGIVAEAWERTPGGKRRGTGYGPAPVPEGLPEHVEDWHRRCR